MPPQSNATQKATSAQIQDFYSHTLARVNNSNAVIANADIRNAQGVLLISKGANITQSRAELIARHKLIQPLEECVDLDRSLDAKNLYSVLEKFVATLPGLKIIMNETNAWKEIKKRCLYYEKFPLVRQKLSVLANQLPQIYYHSLYSALAGVVIGITLDVSARDLNTIFIAGLMHNTGYLHLAPEFVTEEYALDEENISPELQAHPLIAKHFLDLIKGMPKDVGIAVAEHHERTDGTGFPRGRFANDLSLNGQIIAMTDTIVKAYHRYRHQKEHTDQLLLLILQLNDNIHFDKVYKAVAKLTLRGPMPSTPPPVPANPIQVLSQREHILSIFDAAKKLAFILMKCTRNRHTKSIASMLGRLATSIISSGMTQDEFKDWLEGLAQHNDEHEALALLKSHVMFNEIEAQLKKLIGIMWKTIDNISPEEKSLKEDCVRTYQHVENLMKAFTK